jgi:hypothetical protein
MESPTRYTDLTGNGHHLDISQAAMVMADHMSCHNSCSGANTFTGISINTLGIGSGSPWTMSGWYLATGFTVVQVAWQNDTTTNSFGFKWPISSGGVTGDAVYDNLGPNVGGTLLNGSTWYHIVIADNGSGDVSFYIDGTLDDYEPLATYRGIAVTRLCSSTAAGSAFCGDVADVRIYDRELDGDEVDCLYSLGR